MAIYNAGGMNRAVAAALRQWGQKNELTFVGHGLTPNSVRLLRDGVMDLVIDQNPEAQAQRALEILLHRNGRLNSAPEADLVPFSIHVSEGLQPNQVNWPEGGSHYGALAEPHGSA